MIGFTTLCRLAMSRKHLAFNPFREYKNTKKDKDRGYLLRNELEQLVTFNCDIKKDELVKHLFVFTCFTGLSYSEMKGLKNSNLSFGTPYVCHPVFERGRSVGEFEQNVRA